METNNRFDIKQQLGEGSFSKIYLAYDKHLKKEVALKVEKEDKHKKILKFEYEILRNLQGLPHIPRLYDFVENKTLNFIVMELLGKNVANYKKSKHDYNSLYALDVLIQMLNSIEALHDRGYIHRDIKPTNFVMGKYNPNDPKSENIVYMVDFGLAKLHLDKYSKAIPPRTNTDFRGTLTYASLNAHNKKELSRRDDLWSFFFVILDLLNETLPWRNCKDDKDDIRKVKEICLADPEKKLLLTTSKSKTEILEIYIHLKQLKYDERPNYYLIKKKLEELMTREYMKYIGNISGSRLCDYSSLYNMYDNNQILNSFMETIKPIQPIQPIQQIQPIQYGIPTLQDTFYNFNYGYNYYTMNAYYDMLTKMAAVYNSNSLSNINANLTKRKRNRDEIEELEIDRVINTGYNSTNIPINPQPVNIPITTPQQSIPTNQQNQIFIINQFNKNKMTDLEKTILDMLKPQPVTTTNKDRNLINNIKDKLKPSNESDMIGILINSMLKSQPNQTVFSDLNKNKVKGGNVSNKECKKVIFKIEKNNNK